MSTVTLYGWVRAARYCELTGESIETVNERIKQGKWAAGREYKRTGPRTLWIHHERANEWVENQPHVEASLAA